MQLTSQLAPTDSQEAAITDQQIPPAPSMTDQLMGAYQAFSDGDWSGAGNALLWKVAMPSAAALAALVVLYLVAKLVSRWVSTFLTDRFDRSIGYFGGQLIFYSIMLFSGLAILQTLGVGITAFAAVLGAMGLAIGLALQGTLSNFASGVLLLVFRPFKAGDLVQTAGVFGKVNAIELFTTTFDTPDNRRLIVPNSSIVGATIENISFHHERRVEIVVGVDYSARLDTTRQVLNSCAEAVSDLLVEGEGRGFSVLLAGLGANSVDWKVRAWTSTENFFAMQEQLTEHIKRSLDAAQITIPFPQLQLHLPGDEGRQTDATAPTSGVSSEVESTTSPTTPVYHQNEVTTTIGDDGHHNSSSSEQRVSAPHLRLAADRRRVRPRSRNPENPT